MTSPEYERLREAIERAVVESVDRTADPVGEVWKLVTDISIAKWEDTPDDF